MRIAVISDIHSNLEALDAVIAALPQFDELYCLGDLVGYGPQPNEVVEKILQLEPTVVLSGNHDHAVVTGGTEGFSTHAAKAVEWTRQQIKPENRDYLARLQPSCKVEKARISIGLFHGSPWSPLTEYIFPGLSESEARNLIFGSGSSVILLGHTHVPMLYSYGREMLANPGSVGQPRDGNPKASFALLTVSESSLSFEVERVEYDVSTAADKIVRAGLPKFLAERLYTGM